MVEEVQRHPLDKVGLTSTGSIGSATRILERGRLSAMPGLLMGTGVQGGCGLLNISLALCLCVAVLVGGQRGRVPAPLSPGSGPDCWSRIGAQQQFRVRTILESLGRTLDSVPTGSSIVLLDDPNAHVAIGSVTWRGVVRNGKLLKIQLQLTVI